MLIGCFRRAANAAAVADQLADITNNELSNEEVGEQEVVAVASRDHGNASSSSSLAGFPGGEEGQAAGGCG